MTFHQFGLFVSIAKRLNVIQISRDLHNSQPPKIVVFLLALLGGWLLSGNPFIGNGSFLLTDGIAHAQTGLVGWWKFDEGSGSTTAADSSGNGHTGTLQGAAWTSGKIGQALSFNGSSTYVDVPYATDLDPTGTITLSGWIYLNAYTEAGAIIGKSTDAFFDGYLLQLSAAANCACGTTHRLRAFFGTDFVDSNQDIPLQSWTHVAATYDTNANEVKLYINGALDKDATFTTNITGGTGTIRIGEFTIPVSESHPQRLLNGKIDEARIYNRVLSATEIQGLYNGGSGSFTLTIASSNPTSGASITVSPNDNNSQGNGTTQFTRVYNNNTAVTLTAASTAGGNNFSGWSGCDSSSGTTCNVTMSADRTVTATYTTLPPPTRILTVASSNPASGASVGINPADNNSAGNGTTQFTRIYNDGTAVTLTAASTAGGNNFNGWSGCDSSSGVTCSVTMNADRTVTATYQTTGSPWEIRDEDGATIVVITDQAALDRHLQGIWAQWKAALASGQTDLAASYMDSEKRANYKRAFDTLAINGQRGAYYLVPGYYGDITWDEPPCLPGTPCKTYGPFVQYTRSNGKTVTFRLEKDQTVPEGIWKIESLGG